MCNGADIQGKENHRKSSICLAKLKAVLNKKEEKILLGRNFYFLSSYSFPYILFHLQIICQ